MTPAAFGAVSPWRITHAGLLRTGGQIRLKLQRVESRARQGIQTALVLADGLQQFGGRLSSSSASSFDLRVEEHGIRRRHDVSERLHPVGIGQDRLVAVEGVQKWLGGQQIQFPDL